MEKNLQTYFSTGEFAQLCHVTKNTLFHYDQIGLLKPESVRDNGYRCYSLRQFYAMDVITVLKEAGTPLTEIQQYLAHQSVPLFLSLMAEKERHIAHEIAKLQRMRRSLLQTIEMTRSASELPRHQARLESHLSESLIAMRFPKQSDERNFIEAVGPFFAECDRRRLEVGYHLGSIKCKDMLLCGDYFSYSYLFTKTAIPYVSSAHPSRGLRFFKHKKLCLIQNGLHNIVKRRCYLYQKPAGLYAVLEHHGSYETTPHSYEKLLRFIAEQGLTVSGSAYEWELIGYLAVEDPEQFVIEISIPVTESVQKATKQKEDEE